MFKYVKLIVALLLFNSVIFSQSVVSIGKVVFAGNPVLVPISVSGPALTNVKSISLQIKYDPASISFNHTASSALSGISGLTLSPSSNFSVTQSNGLISISWFNSTGVSLSGLLFNLEFNYTSSFSEIRFISATIKNMLGAKLTFNLTHGSIAPTTDPVVIVQYPNGGETLEVIGSPTTIKWTSVYINLLNIDYTTDNGTTWNPVVGNYDATLASYDWTIPTGINSSDCKIKITDTGSAATDESNSVFTINSTPVLTLLSPNGGEDLKVGGVKKISWTFKNILNAKLEFTTNASNPTPTWNTIVASITAKNVSYDWTIPNSVSTDCKIRITDLANTTTVFDLSDLVFTISNTPVNVSIPDIVEAHLIRVGRVVGFPSLADLFWWSGFPDYVWDNPDADYNSGGIIYRSRDTLIVDGKVPVNVGWLTSITYLEMKISFNPNVLKFDSLKVAIPEMIPMSASVQGDEIHIIWSGNAPIDIQGNIFDMYFTYKNLNNPLQWFPTGWNYGSAPSATPAIPTAVLDPRNLSEIKIGMVTAKNSKNNNIDASAWTNGSLAVSNSPAVKLLTPIGGEFLEVNDVTKNILWSSKLVTNVFIKYSTNNGVNWIPITASTPATTGSFAWTLPNINSSQCIIKIASTADTTVADISGSAFTISNVKTLDLTSPNGGDVLKVGSNKIITWTSRNISNVKLEFSTNYDTTWTDIAASVPAKNYSYIWQVPNTPSVLCRVRISDATNAAQNDVSSGNFEINNSNVIVSLPTMTSFTGNVTIPVTVDKVNSITYINFSIQYNTANLVFDHVQSSASLSSGNLGYSTDNGIVRIVWISSTPIDVSGNLFSIYFTGFTGAITPLTFVSPNQIKDLDNKLIPIDLVNGGLGLTDVETTIIPKTFALQQNFPNPFNPSTVIRFEVPKASNVNLTIYNILGQKIATLVDEHKNPGYYEIKWDASYLSNGIYFYSIRAEDFVLTKKMILLK